MKLLGAYRHIASTMQADVWISTLGPVDNEKENGNCYLGFRVEGSSPMSDKCWDNGKEKGSCYSMLGLYRDSGNEMELLHYNRVFIGVI